MAGWTTFRAVLRYATSLAGLVLVAGDLLPSSPGVVNAQQTPPGDPATQAVAFDEYFLAQTMRVDYYHSGNAGEDRIALERVVRDGVWAGGRTRLTDTLDLGLYCFEVRDQPSQQLLYARGFCSVFGEWQTTAPAKQQWGTFHESLRFPWPRQPVDVVLKRRHEGAWRELWTATVDPNSRFVVNADPPPASGPVWTLCENGPTAEKVDLLFLGDGYTSAEVEKFHRDTQRLVDRLFAVEPFQSRRTDFNVRAMDVCSGLSGIAQPRDGVFRRSAFSCQYDTFDLERYVLTADNRTLRDIASAAPYDNLIILLNNKKYGGGGIYNDQTTVAADCMAADYIIVHEFGHHLAGLGDEYYVSNVAYETGKLPRFEPWEPNVTALLDSGAWKWKDLVAPDTPIPTPWEKEAFEAASRPQHRQQQPPPPQPADDGEDEKSRAASREKQNSTAQILQASPYASRVGAFEGASYETQGLYRPAVDCIMFSRHPVGFCPVCRRAIERAIDQHTGQQQLGRYIPDPQPVQTKLLIGAHHCPLWEADKLQMWDNVVPQVVTVSQGWSGWRDEGSIWKIPPSDYESLLRQAKDFVSTLPADQLGSRMLLLDNWNEWGEGHYIAPHREYGFGYLDAVRKVFSDAPPEHTDLVPSDIGLGPYDQAYKAREAEKKQ